MDSTHPGTTPRYDPSYDREVHRAKSYRGNVWRHTHHILRFGAYTPEEPLPGHQPEADEVEQEAPQSVSVPILPEMLAITHIAGRGRFPAPASQQSGPPPVSPRVTVQDVDCLVAAETLAARGLKCLVMDAGSRRHFGGGYQHGSRAQEEELCRRTTLAAQCDCSVGFQQTHLYPLPPADAIHVPRVKIFRRGADDGYRLMARPVEAGVGIVAAYNRPQLDREGKRLVGQAAKDTMEMLRSYFNAAAQHGYDAVICIAVGCGAFRNPASHVAELYARVLALPEVTRAGFKEIVFAVLDDHNAFHEFNPEGNFAAFGRVLAQSSGATVLTREGRDVTKAVVAGQQFERPQPGTATFVAPHPNSVGAAMPPASSASAEGKVKPKAKPARKQRPSLAHDDDAVIYVDDDDDDYDDHDDDVIEA